MGRVASRRLELWRQREREREHTYRASTANNRYTSGRCCRPSRPRAGRSVAAERRRAHPYCATTCGGRGERRRAWVSDCLCTMHRVGTGERQWVALRERRRETDRQREAVRGARTEGADVAKVDCVLMKDIRSDLRERMHEPSLSSVSWTRRGDDELGWRPSDAIRRGPSGRSGGR